MYKYIPRKHYLVIEKVVNNSTKLVMPDNPLVGEQDGELFRVITVGEDVEMVGEGDLVFVVGYIHTVTHDGKKFTLTQDTSVLMVVREEK